MKEDEHDVISLNEEENKMCQSYTNDKTDHQESRINDRFGFEERTMANSAVQDQELIASPSIDAPSEEGASISCSQDSYGFEVQLPGSTRRSFLDEILAARE
jgi:hypothetical protein